ncbi:MAG: periplasmic heavy metal sensor [Bacteroidales bacterium]|jgi:Spy/CpxP family protein refolding chaperone|nr:periplasmic heavy metal sensor [Bacteroidales bacterium]
MKTKKITTGILAIALIVGMSLTANAQRGQRVNKNKQGMRAQAKGQGFNQDRQMGADCAYMQLSEEQQTEVAKLHLALTEKNLPVRNQLGEMHAKMQSLKTGDNQDFKTISNLIDDMSKVQAQIRKNAAKHHLSVRDLLTNDQQVMFDARQGKGGKGNRANKGNAKRGNKSNCVGMIR